MEFTNDMTEWQTTSLNDRGHHYISDLFPQKYSTRCGYQLFVMDTPPNQLFITEFIIFFTLVASYKNSHLFVMREALAEFISK